MNFAVRHSTVYIYSGPVHLEPHVVRLRPRSDGAQRLLEYNLQIEPRPAGSSESLDQDGNTVVNAWFKEPYERLEIASTFEVETLRENPFDFLIAASSTRVPLIYPPPLEEAMRQYLADSAAPSLAELAQSIAEEAGFDTVGFVMLLNQRLFERTSHIVRPYGPPLSPEQTLAAGEGSCRDIAVLFCSACRAMGIAARFVSGYEREAASHHQAYMHAWAEVFFPGAGWRGFDASRGIAVSTAHVAVAAAAQPEMAAPVTGSYFGNASSRMEVSIDVRVEARQAL